MSRSISHRRGPSRRLAPLAILLGIAVSWAGASEPDRRIRIETRVSRVANMVHWMDNLAGTSLGKTRSAYVASWRGRFGPYTAEEASALESFARLRRKRVRPGGAAVSNQRGCVPVRTGAMSWHRIFLAESMKAGSIDRFVESLSPHLDEEERRGLRSALRTFLPRFRAVWRDLRHVRRFEGRFRRFLEKGGLLDYLDEVADFLGVDPGDSPPMTIAFIGLPVNGSTHAEADGDYLLVEIRPDDAPGHQIQVIAHEATHYLMSRLSVEQIDRLARQAFEVGSAGGLAWRLIWEGLPTSLGQGLAEARLGDFSAGKLWYHVPAIDSFAKLIYPEIAEAVDAGVRLDEGPMSAITRTLAGSGLGRGAPAAAFLGPAFFASGHGLEGALRAVRRRVGLAGQSGKSFRIGDPAGDDLLERYECLGGIVLIRPAEIETAAVLNGERILTAEAQRRTSRLAGEDLAVIAPGRRRGGGVVLYLVVPEKASLAEAVDVLARLRGVPMDPVIATGDL